MCSGADRAELSAAFAKKERMLRVASVENCVSGCRLFEADHVVDEEDEFADTDDELGFAPPKVQSQVVCYVPVLVPYPKQPLEDSRATEQMVQDLTDKLDQASEKPAVMTPAAALKSPTAFSALPAPELVAWLQQNAPEKYVEDRLRQLCKKAATMDSLDGADEEVSAMLTPAAH
jgi:hypothetical protein